MKPRSTTAENTRRRAPGRLLRTSAIALILGVAAVSANAASAQSLAVLDMPGYTLIGPPNAQANAAPGEPLRVCAPPATDLPGGFSYIHPPVEEIARALSINLCHVALAPNSDVDAIMADARALGLNLEIQNGGGTAYASAPPLPPLGSLGDAPPPLPPLGAPQSYNATGSAPPLPPIMSQSAINQSPYAPPTLAAPAMAVPAMAAPSIPAPVMAAPTMPGHMMTLPPLPAASMSAPPMPIVQAPRPAAPSAPSWQSALAQAPLAPQPVVAQALAPIGGGDAQVIFKSAYDSLSQGQAGDAADQFIQGLQIDPSSRLGHYYLGVAYQRIGRTDYASTQYHRVIDGWPGSQEATMAEANMRQLLAAFAPRPAETRPQQIARPHRRDRRRIRSIEEIFAGSKGADTLAGLARQKRRQARNKAKAQQIARTPQRNAALIRVAKSGKIAQARSAPTLASRRPSFGEFGKSAGTVGTFADQPARRVDLPAPITATTGTLPSAAPPLLQDNNGLPPLGAPMLNAPPLSPLPAPDMSTSGDLPPLTQPTLSRTTTDFGNDFSAPPLPPLGAPAAPAMAAPNLPLPNAGNEIAFQDGARYRGAVQNGQPNGIGEMTYADGSKYSGSFRDGLRNGQGRMTLPDGLIYEGSFSADAINGQGKLNWPDGAAYTGAFINGKRTGEGAYQWPSGSRYEGRFDDGVIVGPGVFTSADGERYQGDFQNGRRTGRGTLTLPTGERYEGQVLDGLPHGAGVYAWPNGQRYNGEFREGRIEGRGTMTYADGQSRDGLWSNGQPAG